MTSEYSIRESTADDLEKVAEIKVRNWAETYGSILQPAVLRPFLDRARQLADLRRAVELPTTALLVAEGPSGTVVGFALGYMAHEPEPLLESLHVVGEHRGHGVGTLLMRSTAAHLMAHGYSSLRLGVLVGNVDATRFYEGLGATMVGVEPVSWANGVSHQVYRWSSLEALAP